MRPRFSTLSALVLALGVALVASPIAAVQDSPAHTHMGHVMTGFGGAPDGAGLLPTALAETETAREHVDLAAQDMSNLDWMQQQAEQVLHAVDPSQVGEGPGLGFGVKAAAQGIVQHIELAASSEGASENVQTHAIQVSAAAAAVVERAEEIATLASQVLDASDYTSAEGLVVRMRRLANQLVEGADENDDGEISIGDGEGGLGHVQRHMELMMAGENM